MNFLLVIDSPTDDLILIQFLDHLLNLKTIYLESESKGLKEEISKIKARNHKEKSYIYHLENENSTLEKRLAETLTKSEPDVSISPIKFTLNKS